MFKVFYAGKWIFHVPASEALVFKEEGYLVERM